MITPSDLVSRAVFLKLPAVAITDHWTTYGHHTFHRLAVEAGVKPILGVESRHRSLTGGDGLHHLTLLAENDQGYKNLVTLVNLHTAGDREGYVTADELAGHSAGLIALTGCLEGEVAHSVLHGNLGRIRDIVAKLLSIFGDENLYLEIMNHNLPQERLVVDQLALLSKRLGVPLVVTNNDRYIGKDEGEHYRLLRSLGSKEVHRDAEDSPDEFYLKRGKELEPYFYGLGDALERSGEIAGRCTVSLPTRGRIVFFGALNPGEILREKCRRRFLLRFHDSPPGERTFLEGVLEKELDCAHREGLAGFLLFLRELFARADAGGIWLEMVSSNVLESIVAYLLGIAPLNPIEHDLIFESFTSGDPGTPPAVEFMKSKGSRRTFISILEELLPDHRIFFQLTQEAMSFQTLVKEVGDVLGMTRELQEEIARLLPADRKRRGLAVMLESSEPLRHLYRSEELVRRTLHGADALRGKVYRFHMNSSRLVILPRDMKSYVSFVAGQNGERFVQLGNASIEEAGGWIAIIQHSHYLSTLERIIAKHKGASDKEPALFRRRRSGGGMWRPERLDDPQVYALISSGRTDGVYLLESQGIRDLLVKVKPSTFDELVNVISLYRPAPLEGRLWQRYLENAEKKGKVNLPHHFLAASLEKTRGLLLYNEQVREILGFSAGLECEEAAAVSHALQERVSGELSHARMEFIRGAMDKGLDDEEAQRIFDFLLHNIAYTHNKAQSCYEAYLSYRTAFFKAHLFNGYFLALLNSNFDVREKQKKYIDYVKHAGMTVLPVDINASGIEFVQEGDAFRTPLQFEHSIEKGELEGIIRERSENGPFVSLLDFMKRSFGTVGMKTVMGLIEDGAFDSGGVDKGELIGICADFYDGGGKVGFFTQVPTKPAKQKGERKPTSQLSMFDDLDGD